MPQAAEQTADLATVTAELQSLLTPARRGKDGDFLRNAEVVRCADGLSMSVQASAYHYCSPRDSKGPWHKVEVGFPSREVPELDGFAEDPEDPTGTVYGYVPIERVAAAIIAAGGFATPA